MVELVRFIVGELVDDREAIVITETDGVIKISVAQKDMGKIIGKQGRIAKAIRTVVRAAGLKNGQKVSVDILEAGGTAGEIETAEAEDAN